MSTLQSTRAWEGLGGPLQVDDHRSLASRMIDPTLDSCCQREIEDELKGNAFRRVLQRHDVVAERERRRRHLVDATGFQGCRCSYDPGQDGGEYPALNALRTARRQLVDMTTTTTGGSELYCGFIGPDPQAEQEKEADTYNDDENDNNGSDSDDEFDYLLDEDLPGQSEELQMIEEQRRAELEMNMLEREIELQHGYGEHRQMHPSRALKVAGLSGGAREPPPFVVVHLFDSQSDGSASLDLYLEDLARQMRGTLFIRSDGRMTFSLEPLLAQKALPKGGADLPALIAIKDGVAIQASKIQLFTDSNDNDYIVKEAVHDWLRQSGVLQERAPPLEALCFIRPEEAALLDHMAQNKPPPQPEFFQCGLPGCQKTFYHEHVGVETAEQSGLVLSESQVLGETKQF